MLRRLRRSGIRGIVREPVPGSLWGGPPESWWSITQEESCATAGGQGVDGRQSAGAFSARRTKPSGLTLAGALSRPVQRGNSVGTNRWRIESTRVETTRTIGVSLRPEGCVSA